MKMCLENLLQACKNGDLEMVKNLVANGVNVNERIKNMGTPLFVALECSNLEIAKYLLEHEADINMANQKGETPLTGSSETGEHHGACTHAEAGLADAGGSG